MSSRELQGDPRIQGIKEDLSDLVHELTSLVTPLIPDGLRTSLFRFSAALETRLLPSRVVVDQPSDNVGGDITQDDIPNKYTVGNLSYPGILQSRVVVDHPSADIGADMSYNEIPNNDTMGAMSHDDIGGNMSHNEIPNNENMGAISCPDILAPKPDLPATTIMEVKTLSELASIINPDLDHGSCTLNTNTLKYFEEHKHNQRKEAPTITKKRSLQNINDWITVSTEAGEASIPVGHGKKWVLL